LDIFYSCDLDLDPITFIYELDPYSIEIYRMCAKMNFLIAGIHHTALRVVKNHTYTLFIILSKDRLYQQLKFLT